MWPGSLELLQQLRTFVLLLCYKETNCQNIVKNALGQLVLALNLRSCGFAQDQFNANYRN
jgi:hypothetical protein